MLVETNETETGEVDSLGEDNSVKDQYVYVLDDEIQVLEVIAMQLKTAGFVVSTFSSGSEFLKQIDELPAGVVLSDQRMPDIDGLKVQQELRAFSHKFQLILLSGYPETRIAVEAMKQGAVTVLDKPYNKEQLISSIQEAFEILAHVKPEIQGLPPVLSGGERYMSRLSLRERQVIDLVYQGETNKSIGIQLGISIKTVEKHRGKAMKKMEVSSLAELIRLMDREQGR